MTTAEKVSRDGFPTGRLCGCHGLPMDYRPRDGKWECAEKRRARQRAYVQRRQDDFLYRGSELLRSRRRVALWRRARRSQQEG